MKPIEGIWDAILATKGKTVRFYLSSGVTCEGIVKEITYMDPAEKKNRRPRLVMVYHGGYVAYIDAIKIDIVECKEDLCNAESAKKK